ncbi:MULTISPECIES: helix-turn-helix domain-containing protein [Carnobacterium]|uniref:helix-turn-helix domain-containing protein n=1 Tax=Carnobacterium TaxID=2747 RepID=UPI0005508BCD|nr:helix-turn-helix transcriptional regulator [Carnobacterium inhibens]MCM3512032.1 helix-turn-helix domain-containing protein [Carnobacterium inhibens]
MDIYKLRELRKEKKLTQEDMAGVLEIARTTYANYEQGTREPDNKTLNKLADYFQVSTDYLLGRDVPNWATPEDLIDLEEMLNNNVHMAYGGEDLTEEDKQRVQDVLAAVFWDRMKKRRD